jgi:hypothetical protein
MRHFAAEARLSGLLLGEVSDEDVRQTIRHAIKHRLLVGMRKGPGGGQAISASVLQRRLIRRIEQETRGRIQLAGRRYRLVADADLGGVPRRGDYEVVARQEAGRVLDALAREPGTTAELAGLLAEARAMLAADWRPPAHAEGLILLRRIPVAASVPSSSSAPALTPSQLHEQLEQVDPMIEGDLVELDLSVAELPAEPDATDEAEEPVAAADASSSETAAEETSGPLDDSDQDGPGPRSGTT